MPPITPEERKRRHIIVESTLGTHAMEGMFPDDATLLIMRRYESGELDMDQFSAELGKHADALVAELRPLAGAA